MGSLGFVDCVLVFGWVFGFCSLSLGVLATEIRCFVFFIQITDNICLEVRPGSRGEAPGGIPKGGALWPVKLEAC